MAHPQIAYPSTLPVPTLDQLIHRGLTGLFNELQTCNWYVREHELVNLFVFGNLVPMFQERGLDLTMIGIEYPAMQAIASESSRFGARKDLVIWPEPRMTLWKGCELTRGMELSTLHALGCKPLAIIEWKNISRITRTPVEVRNGHQLDIEWLRRNVEANMVQVGFAVLVDQSTNLVRLNCKRVANGTASDFLRLPG